MWRNCEDSFQILSVGVLTPSHASKSYTDCELLLRAQASQSACKTGTETIYLNKLSQLSLLQSCMLTEMFKPRAVVHNPCVRWFSSAAYTGCSFGRSVWHSHPLACSLHSFKLRHRFVSKHLFADWAQGYLAAGVC